MLLMDTHNPRARNPETQVASSNRMSAEREGKLARRSQRGGRAGAEARNELVMANYGLIHMVAGQYRRAGMRYEDLVQEGALGLMRAAETFDPDRGVRFGTYAVYWIRSKVQRFIEAQRRESNPLMAGVDAVASDDGRRHIPRGSTLSLDAPVDVSADRTVADTVSDPEAMSPEDTALNELTRQRLEQALWSACHKLQDPRATVILQHRLLADEPETLSEVGKRLRLSREGARILEMRVLKAARHALRGPNTPAEEGPTLRAA